MNNPFKLLLVCTANLCRSPTAQGFLNRAVIQAGLQKKIKVDSAGLIDTHVGSPPHPPIKNAALDFGVDLADLRARQIKPEDLKKHHLILGMTVRHVAELKTIQAENNSVRENNLPANIDLYLNFSDCFKGEDLPDPYRGDSQAYARAVKLIDHTTPYLLKALREKIGL